MEAPLQSRRRVDAMAPWTISPYFRWPLYCSLLEQSNARDTARWFCRKPRLRTVLEITLIFITLKQRGKYINSLITWGGQDLLRGNDWKRLHFCFIPKQGRFPFIPMRLSRITLSTQSWWRNLWETVSSWNGCPYSLFMERWPCFQIQGFKIFFYFLISVCLLGCARS